MKATVNRNVNRKTARAEPLSDDQTLVPQLTQAVARLQEEVVSGLEHGHFDITIKVSTSNCLIRELSIDAGQVYSYRIPATVLVAPFSAAELLTGERRELLVKAFQELRRGLKHGYFEMRLTGRLTKGGCRLVFLKAGKSYRFLMPAQEFGAV